MSWMGLWKPQFGEIIPVEWYSTVVDALDVLYAYSSGLTTQLDDLRNTIETKLDLANHYLRFISAGRGIMTIEKTVTTSPTPLFVDELQVRRIVIKVPATALYGVWIGDSNYQQFFIDVGEKEELFVKDPRTVYIRADGETKVWLLFELVQ